MPDRIEAIFDLQPQPAGDLTDSSATRALPSPTVNTLKPSQ